jgi:hypothetical protein
VKCLLLLVLATLAGCMPYAIPPFTGNVGATHTTERASRTALHADVGLSPLQLSPSQLHRRWDATVSASVDREIHNVWGAAIAAGPVVHPWGRIDATHTARVLPQVVGRWTTEGRAVALRIGVERAGFVGPDGAPKDAQGWGEIALGLYAEAAYLRPDYDDDDDRWSVTVGMSIRLPAIVGVACCFSPH